MRRLVENLIAAYAPLARCRALVDGWPPPRFEASVPRRPRGKGIALSTRFFRFPHFLQEVRP